MTARASMAEAAPSLYCRSAFRGDVFRISRKGIAPEGAPTEITRIAARVSMTLPRCRFVVGAGSAAMLFRQFTQKHQA
jgi:hypothetical protein